MFSFFFTHSLGCADHWQCIIKFANVPINFLINTTIIWARIHPLVGLESLSDLMLKGQSSIKSVLIKRNCHSSYIIMIKDESYKNTCRDLEELCKY